MTLKGKYERKVTETLNFERQDSMAYSNSGLKIADISDKFGHFGFPILKPQAVL